MVYLAAFADEIDPDIDVQIRHLKLNGVTHFELRGVAGKNVLDFDVGLKSEIKSKISDAGLGVVSIGSPIGKVAIDKPWQEHFDRFKTAVDMATFFESPLIRVFSYYPPGGEGKGDVKPHANEVFDRFRKKVEYIKDLPVTLVHENEKGIYGEKVAECVRLMSEINSPKLRTAFDFANFVQAGEKPLENWPHLKAYTTHIHIKDAILGSGKVVPAGHGDGDIEAIVVDAYKSGYRGFLSLEPHLKVAAHSHGETGPELFKTAADALKAILVRNDIPIDA
ncbi:MAG TPA: sugar phosphate isomerase/epimerase family protein [Tepidisphaeraceae bacterium]|jgi:sugar phosphate isomerase/epimerase